MKNLPLEVLQLLLTVLAMLFAIGWTWGVNFVFQDGEIFGKAGEWLENKLPVWALKPTIGCPVCMASVHGTLIFIVFLLGLVPWWYWFFFLLSLCGFNAIIRKYIYGE